jgi:transcriptional regulator with XRE-family HTH domain
MSVSLGKAIAYFREDKKGWSQSDLANNTGIPQPTISLYESQKRNPSKENLEKLVVALQVTISELEIKAKELNKEELNKIVTRPLSSISTHRKKDEINFYITEDIYVSLRSVVSTISEEHSNVNELKDTPINQIVEKVVYMYLLENNEVLQSIITKKLKDHQNEVSSLIEKLNSY